MSEARGAAAISSQMPIRLPRSFCTGSDLAHICDELRLCHYSAESAGLTTMFFCLGYANTSSLLSAVNALTLIRHIDHVPAAMTMTHLPLGLTCDKAHCAQLQQYILSSAGDTDCCHHTSGIQY